MIISVVLGAVWHIVSWIIGLFGSIPGFPAGAATTVSNYISYWIQNGAGLLFFVFRRTTVLFALDVLFFIWAAEPLYFFVMWLIRKIPFLGVH